MNQLRSILEHAVVNEVGDAILDIEVGGNPSVHLEDRQLPAFVRWARSLIAREVTLVHVDLLPPGGLLLATGSIASGLHVEVHAAVDARLLIDGGITAGLVDLAQLETLVPQPKTGVPA